MLKFLLPGCLILFSLCVYGQKNRLPKISSGSWKGTLQLTKTDQLPFQFEINKLENKYAFYVINGQEKIEVNPVYLKDSITLRFSEFNSQMVLKTGKKKMTGYWQNFNKGANYKIPLILTKGYVHRFNSSKLYLSTTQASNFDGKWESTFEQKTPDEYKAVGIFNQSYNKLSGTFLTETGDYRYLDGNVVGDSMYLSCFDGSHAFLFNGHLNNEKIEGNFFSGKHWQTTWEAVRNESFELRHPDSLTYLIKKDPFAFKLKDVNGNEFSFPNAAFENKVTIIQIMGTWCPNCMDETVYLKDLHSRYNKQGLEIISVGYEIGNSFEEYSAKIKRLKDRLNLPFTFLVGGSANKNLVSEQFPMLNQITSFPTAIIIGKDGTVRKIHTGFNGPGTGVYYTEFIKENDLFIQGLIKE